MDIENILAIANEFYQLNDIKINRKKLDLLVLNCEDKIAAIEIGSVLQELNQTGIFEDPDP
ncbi:21316_t:CDS:1, partial [Gigaspora rosea]